MKPHRATGNPRGRPKTLSPDLGDRILAALRHRTDPETGLVSPLYQQLAKEVGVSRSTVARQLALLRQEGKITSIFVPTSSTGGETFYRLGE